MYFTFTKKNIVLWGSLLATFFAYKCMRPLFVVLHRTELVYISWGLTVVLSAVLYKDIIRISKSYRFVKWFLLYIIFSQIIIWAYSMTTYDENIFDMLFCAGSYLLLLFVYFLLIGMELYGTKEFLNYFFVFSMIFLVLSFINALSVNYLHYQLLCEYLVSKTAYMRASLGSLYSVLMVVFIWKVASGNRDKKTLFIFLFGIFLELYIQQTRMYQLAFLFSGLFIWLFQERKAETKLKQLLIVILFSAVFFGLGLHQELVNSFSIDAAVNSNASSSIARLNAMAYFSEYLYANPWIGMGWVRPRSDYLTLIFSGPNGTAFFDDLGFLGQVFRQGILGGMVYVLLVARLFFIEIKLPKTSKYKSLVLGIIVFICVSSISLNCFDGQRILGTAFFIAITEKIYYEEITKKDDRLIVRS